MENFKLKCYCGNEIEIEQGDTLIKDLSKKIDIEVYDKNVHALRISCNKCSRTATIYYK